RRVHKESASLQEGGGEAIRNAFEYVDSSLNRPGDFRSFQGTFRNLLPEGQEDLRVYIENTLQERKGHAVGVEFGGPGVALFEDFTPHFFRKTIGVTLREHRRPEQIMDLETHTVLEGDVRTSTTYRALEEKLGGERADLIVERLLGGWDFIQNDPRLFGAMLKKWYSFLNEDGLLIAEGPPPFQTAHKEERDFFPLLQRWADVLEERHPESLTVRVARSPEFRSPVFSLQRKQGAPEELPLLEGPDGIW
ncbi:MAG: hypothetical protein AAB921_03570, partial [Patescibacteria group bacterium]